MVTYCESVKELLAFLEYIYSGKEQVNKMYDIFMTIFPAQKEQFVMNYFMQFKLYVDLDTLFTFSFRYKGSTNSARKDGRHDICEWTPI